MLGVNLTLVVCKARHYIDTASVWSGEKAMLIKFGNLTFRSCSVYQHGESRQLNASHSLPSLTLFYSCQVKLYSVLLLNFGTSLLGNR